MSRTFYDLPPKLTDEESELRLQWHRLKLMKPLQWSDLLRSRRVLIVSEAGAGKSFECEQQVRSLVERGETAFFFRLEYLDSHGVREILFGEERERFQSWLDTGDREAFFFLDSLYLSRRSWVCHPTPNFTRTSTRTIMATPFS